MSWCGVCGNCGRASGSEQYVLASKGKGKGKIETKLLYQDRKSRILRPHTALHYTRLRNASHWQRQRQSSKNRKTPCTIERRQQSQHSLTCSLVRRVGSSQCVYGSRHASAC
jgi:hypothetical protein